MADLQRRTEDVAVPFAVTPVEVSVALGVLGVGTEQVPDDPHNQGIIEETSEKGVTAEELGDDHPGLVAVELDIDVEAIVGLVGEHRFEGLLDLGDLLGENPGEAGTRRSDRTRPAVE